MNAAQIMPFLRQTGLAKDWSDKLLLSHLVWRAQRGECLTQADAAGRPQAVATWHQAETPEALREPWRRAPAFGSHLYWDLVATAPGTGLAAMWRRFTRRTPDWRAMTMYAHRRGRLRSWPAARVERMVRRAERQARKERNRHG